MAALLLSVALAGQAAAADRAAPLYRYAPATPWVDHATPDYGAPIPSGGAVDGAWYLLIDQQVDVRADGEDTYKHIAIKLEDASGVDGNSQLNMTVDPTYQSLTIHSLRLVRDGEVIDQRPLARVSELPQETELSERVYNGRYNINILLADVRVGDVIDYEYTVHSQEKNFPGHFAQSYSTRWSVPVRQQRIRLRYPDNRAMRMRMNDDSELPAVREAGSMRELVLEDRDIPAIPTDGGRPAWYTPWPYLEVSDLPDWAAVSRLTGPMYGFPSPPGVRVAAIVGQIRTQAGSATEQALHALQYVQEQIRYTSISIGPGAYRPTDPELVVQRRFGDCKDKSFLLATILNALGIDADVALVNSSTGRILDDGLPTPYAFDHAIVRAAIGPEVYWLDGTAAKQHAPLSVDTPADYEWALPVHGSSRELEAIPRPSPESIQWQVAVTMDLRQGIEKPGTLDIVTTYRGTLADRMRPSLSSGGIEQRQVDYVNYAAKYYPGVSVGKTLSIRDDPGVNVLEVDEHYVLQQPFRKNGDGKLALVLHADELYRYSEPMKSSVRTSPLALSYPAHVKQVINVLLPEEWPVEPETVTVENPAFRYRGQVEYQARTLTLTYEYQALKDEVAPEELARYLEDRNRFYDDVGYQLSQDPESTAGAPGFSVAPAPLAALLLALGIGAWSGRRWLYRFDPEPADAGNGARVGIRGWLLLPALHVALLPPVIVVGIMVWGRFISADLWGALPLTVSAGYGWSAQPALLLIVGSQALLLCWGIVLALLFFRKRSSVPIAYAIFMPATTVVYSLALAYLGASGLDSDFSPASFAVTFIRDLALVALWIAYMFRSSRVRATFRARLPAK